MRVSWRAVAAIAGTCTSAALALNLAGMAAGPAKAQPVAAAQPATIARPAAPYYSTAGGLLGVAAATANNAWAVGYAGQQNSGKVLMLHWNGKAWSRVTSPAVLNGTTGQLSAITVVSATSAWAVGFTGAANSGQERSLIMHWNGSTWSQLASPAIAAGELHAVTATATSGWAVGYLDINRSSPACCMGAPLILRWNGSAWSRYAGSLGSGAGLEGVAVTAAKTAWAIGEPTAAVTSILLRWNGSTWSVASSFPVQGGHHPLAGIAAGPGGTAFAVGTNLDTLTPALSMRWTGTAWQAVSVGAPAGSSLNAVTFAPGGTAWSAGATGLSGGNTMILRWTGTAWARVASPGTGSLAGLAFASATDGWAVGASGGKTLILHWDGKAWSSSPPAPPSPTRYVTAGALAGVAAASAGSAWAVGYAGTSSAAKVLMLHWNGSAWSRVTSPSVLTAAGELAAITVVSATNAWAVGYTGAAGGSRTLLLHWNGSAWSQLTSPAPVAGALDAVTVSGNGSWVAGHVPNGQNWPLPLFWRWTGTAWSPVAAPGAIEVVGVAATGASAAWAAGDAEDHSVLGRWNGSAWTWRMPGSAQDLYYLGGIAAGPGGTAFAVGTAILGGAVSTVPVSLKLAGSTWTRKTVSAPASGRLNAVTFAPGGVAWTAGSAGPQTLLLRWTGSAWARVTSPSPGGSNVIGALSFAAAGNGWAVGTSDAKTLILHWNGTAWS